jgi:hypothetical protein
MPFAPRRAAAPVAALALAAVALTACSSKDDPYKNYQGSTATSASLPSGSATATGAAAQASGAPTAAPRTGKKVPAAQLAAQIEQAARAKGSVAFTIVSSGAQQLDGKGEAKGSGTGTELQLTATVAGSQGLEIVKKAGSVYLKPPSPMGGKPWIKITNSPDDMFRPLYAQVFQGLETAGDLSATAAAIKGMGTFRAAGSEVVDGVPTTKYVASPPAKKGVKLLPQVFQTLTAQTLGNAKTTVALWIGADGLLHRTTDVFTIDKRNVATSLVTYSQWGKPVTVSAPPTAQVTQAVRPAG